MYRIRNRTSKTLSLIALIKSCSGVGLFGKRTASSWSRSPNSHQTLHRRCFSSIIPGFSWEGQQMYKGSEQITRVLFCGPHFPASHDYTREYVQDYPFIKVDDVPFDNVPDVIGEYDLCVVKSMRLNAELISRAKRMKLIMQYGVGLEGVDIGAASKHGIKVARIPSGATGNAASCAEMAIYLILGLLRKQNEMLIAVKQKILGVPVGDTLLGKTVFIMGFGHIGIKLAQRLRPFGVKILATKRSWASYLGNSCEAEENGTENDLVDEKGNHEDILIFASKADIVVCCLAMNAETAGIVNDVFVSSMRKGALLINIARGGLLDYNAVFGHLESGHLGGLGIDVAWTEPFDPDDAILKFPNVIITPHVAGVTEYSYRYMAKLALLGIVDAIPGRLCSGTHQSKALCDGSLSSAEKVVGDVALQLHAGKPLTGIEIVN